MERQNVSLGCEVSKNLGYLFEEAVLLLAWMPETRRHLLFLIAVSVFWPLSASTQMTMSKREEDQQAADWSSLQFKGLLIICCLFVTSIAAPLSVCCIMRWMSIALLFLTCDRLHLFDVVHRQTDRRTETSNQSVLDKLSSMITMSVLKYIFSLIRNYNLKTSSTMNEGLTSFSVFKLLCNSWFKIQRSMYVWCHFLIIFSQLKLIRTAAICCLFSEACFNPLWVKPSLIFQVLL